MRVSRAKRRWLKWARYVANTGTRTAAKGTGGWHVGHARAFDDVHFAKRSAPSGARQPYYSHWMWEG